MKIKTIKRVLDEEHAYQSEKIRRQLEESTGIAAARRGMDMLNEDPMKRAMQEYGLLPDPDEPSPEDVARARLDAEAAQTERAQVQAHYGRQGGTAKGRVNADRDETIRREYLAMAQANHQAPVAALSRKYDLSDRRIRQIVKKAET
jgi:hypothetical protein